MSRVLPVGFQFELAYHPGNLISFVLEKQRRRKRGLGSGLASSGEVTLSAEHQEFLRNYRNEYPESYDRELFKERKKNAARAAAVYDPEYEMAFPPSARQVQIPSHRRATKDYGEMLDLAEVGQRFDGPTARIRTAPIRSVGYETLGPPSKAPRYSSGLSVTPGMTTMSQRGIYSVKLPTVQDQSERAVITIPVQEEYSYPGLATQEVVVGAEGVEPAGADYQSAQEAETAANALISEHFDPTNGVENAGPEQVGIHQQHGSFTSPQPPTLGVEGHSITEPGRFDTTNLERRSGLAFHHNAPQFGTRVTSQWDKPLFKPQQRAHLVKTAVRQGAPRITQEAKPIKTPYRAQYYIRDVNSDSLQQIQPPQVSSRAYHIAQPQDAGHHIQQQQQILAQPTVDSHYIIQEPGSFHQGSSTYDTTQDYPNLVAGDSVVGGDEVMYNNYDSRSQYAAPQGAPTQQYHHIPQQSVVYVSNQGSHDRMEYQQHVQSQHPVPSVGYHSVGKPTQQQPSRATFRYTILPSSSSAQSLAPQRLQGSYSNFEDRYAFHSNLKSPQSVKSSPVPTAIHCAGGRVIYHHSKSDEGRFPVGATTIKIVPHQNNRKQNLRPFAEESHVETSSGYYYQQPQKSHPITFSQNNPSPPKAPVRKMFIVKPFPQNIAADPTVDLSPSIHPPDPDHKGGAEQMTHEDVPPVAEKPKTPPPEPWWKKEEKTLWNLVLRNLSRKTLLESCCLVCKDWQTIVENLADVWREIDLSGLQQPLTSEILASVARKKPQILNLSWTGISREDIETLLQGNTRIESISMAGCHWSSVEGLKKLESELLSLDLRWVQGCTDNNFKRLVGEVPKLKLLEELFMSQCDVGDATVRLVANQFNRVKKLDLSYCGKITNLAIEVMGAAGSPARHSIRHFNLANCQNLHSDIFIPLSKLTALSVLDVRACPQISDARCEEFRNASKALGREVTVLF